MFIAEDSIQPAESNALKLFYNPARLPRARRRPFGQTLRRAPNRRRKK